MYMVIGFIVFFVIIDMAAICAPRTPEEVRKDDEAQEAWLREYREKKRLKKIGKYKG